MDAQIPPQEAIKKAGGGHRMLANLVREAPRSVHLSPDGRSLRQSPTKLLAGPAGWPDPQSSPTANPLAQPRNAEDAVPASEPDGRTTCWERFGQFEGAVVQDSGGRGLPSGQGRRDRRGPRTTSSALIDAGRIMETNPGQRVETRTSLMPGRPYVGVVTRRTADEHRAGSDHLLGSSVHPAQQ